MKKFTRPFYVKPAIMGLFVLLFGMACQAQPEPLPTATPQVLAESIPTITPLLPSATAVPSATALPAATETPVPTATVTMPAPPTPTPTPTPGPFKADVGVQIHLHGEDIPALMQHINRVGFGWVKVQVSWKLHEPQPDVYDEVLFAELDQLIGLAEASGVQVMLGVAKAPEWSRPTTELDGPPSDYAQFADFLTYLSQRYSGRIAAYEIWNEANLQREWNGVPMSGADFGTLVIVGASAIRANDPSAFLISGAPAPTGINDRVGAIDDRIFLQEALSTGMANSVDGIGIHPYGWGNPADSRFENPMPVPSHNDHPSFFFLNTVDDYEAILRANGVDPAVKPLWSTEYGWGSTDQFGADPVPGAEFMRYVNEAQQAEYTLRAIEIARERPTMGPMILWNLNFAPTFGTDFSESAYSILRPDGSPRPAYEALWGLE